MAAAAVFHALCAIHFAFGCYYDWNYVKIPRSEHSMGFSFGKTEKLKFLTFWDAIIQAVFFTVCFINDVIGTNEPHPKKVPLIRTIKDTIFTSLAFPLSIFVGGTFWSLYAIDRELIFPRVLDKFFPTWLNHVMHTNIVFLVLIELVTSFRSYPSRKRGIGVLFALLITYLAWIHVIHHYTGLWVYPVLEVLNLPLRIVFFLLLFGMSVSMYLLGEKLNKVFWSNQIREIETGKRKRKH